MKSEQVVGVAVFVCGVVNVAAPLLKLPQSSYLIWSDVIEYALPFIHTCGIDVKLLGGGDGGMQNLTCHSIGIRGAHVCRAMFGRIRRCGSVIAVLVFGKNIHRKICAFAYQWVPFGTQPLFVT